MKLNLHESLRPFLRMMAKVFELDGSDLLIEKEDLKDAMAGWIIFLYIALLLTIIVINVWVFYRNMRPLLCIASLVG